ncbi:MAG TPA: 50S ribosomal protein L30 [Gemmatimonadales bacterium]
MAEKGSGAKKKTAKKTTKKRAAPNRAAATPPPAEGEADPQPTLRVKQVRSDSGRTEQMRRTLRALGLRHYQHETVVKDNPSIRGMLHQVRHLVRVTPEEA